MIRARCPVCEQSFEGESVRDLPNHPFCSERCRLIDLGRWLGGRYAIPAESTGADPEDDSGDGPTPPP